MVSVVRVQDPADEPGLEHGELGTSSALRRYKTPIRQSEHDQPRRTCRKFRFFASEQDLLVSPCRSGGVPRGVGFPFDGRRHHRH